MPRSYETALYRRIHKALDAIPMIDTHEHLQRDSELPPPQEVSIGRFFPHYANSDLISAGMKPADMEKARDGRNGLAPMERWRLLKPYYARAWNTAYFETIRIALRDLYGIDDLSDLSVEPLTEKMRASLRSGFTREVFDRAGIELAMNNPFGPRPAWNDDFDPNCFVVDLVDYFSDLQIDRLSRDTNRQVKSLDDYLGVVDDYFERAGRIAGAFKSGRAYERTLLIQDVTNDQAQGIFNRLLTGKEKPPRAAILALEDFIFHYLCRKCGQYGLRMKFHTGFQEGNGNYITNSNAALLAGLFLKYPQVNFDVFHTSYPYQEEALTLVKNFPNVTINFCWLWIMNPHAGRRALSDMLDALPANKIHGFGGDYIFVEGTYGHAVIAKREIARVLAEKVEEGRFGEDQALAIGKMLLRDNALENFDIPRRHEAFRRHAANVAQKKL